MTLNLDRSLAVSAIGFPFCLFEGLIVHATTIAVGHRQTPMTKNCWVEPRPHAIGTTGLRGRFKTIPKTTPKALNDRNEQASQGFLVVQTSHQPSSASAVSRRHAAQVRPKLQNMGLDLLHACEAASGLIVYRQVSQCGAVSMSDLARSLGATGKRQPDRRFTVGWNRTNRHPSRHLDA